MPRSRPRPASPPSTRHATWAIAPASRTDPALPMTSLGWPESSTTVGVIMLGSRSPGVRSPPRSRRALPACCSAAPLRGRPPSPSRGWKTEPQHRPSPSTTEMCVVPVSAPGHDRSYAAATASASCRSDHTSCEASASRISSTTRPPRDGDGVVSTDTPSRSRLEWSVLANAVGGKIVCKLGDELDHRSRAHVANPFEGGDQVFRGDLRGVAVDALARVGSQQDLFEDPVEEHSRGVDFDAAGPRQGERGLDEICPLPVAEPPVSLLEPGNETWHRDRALPDPERLSVPALEIDDDLVDVAERLRRRSEEAVEDDGFASGLAHEQEPSTGRARERSLDRPRRRRRPRCTRPRRSRPGARHSAPACAVRGWPAAIAPLFDLGAGLEPDAPVDIRPRRSPRHRQRG